MEQHNDDYEKVIEDGPKYVRDGSNDLQTQSLRQQMQDVKDGWRQLHVLWESRKEQLEQSMNYQVRIWFIKNVDETTDYNVLVNWKSKIYWKQVKPPPFDLILMILISISITNTRHDFIDSFYYFEK